MIGDGANVASGNLRNAIAIGSNAIVGADNSLVLGGTGFDQVKVGIGTAIPLTTLDVAGALTFRQFITGAITVDDQFIPIGNVGHLGLTSNSSVIGARTLTLGDGLVIGELLFITNIGLTGNFEIADSFANNTNTPGNQTLNTGDIVLLMWGGNFWNEVSFGDN